MGGLFSFQKEEDPVITIENVVGGDINDSSTHYQVHKEAATTIGVIAVSLSWAVSGTIFKKPESILLSPASRGPPENKWRYLSL